MELPEFELFAIRYATRQARRADHFLGGDPHDGPMPMDYYVWVARSPERSVVFDSGFTAEVAERRGRSFLRCPVDSLRLIGLEADSVDTVVVTHLHYDHAGNFHRFPRAQFHVQDREMAYATGRYMRYGRLSHGFEVDDVCSFVRMNYAGRVRFHDGDVELCPGITLHLAGGHSHGLQFARVHTPRGWVVLASDVAHFYENLTTRRPFSSAFHVGDMYDGFERLDGFALSPAYVIPGHAPLVMQRYPAANAQSRGIVASLHETPQD